MDDQLIQRICQLYESGEKERAIHELGAVLDSTSDTRDKAELAFTLNRWLLAVGRIDDAKSRFERIHGTMPKEGEWWAWAEYCMAELLIAQQKYKAALKKLDSLEEVYRPSLHKPGIARMYTEIQMSRGLLLASLKKFRIARTLLEDVASKDVRKEGDFYYMLGLCRLEDREFERAREALQAGFEVGYPANYEAPAHYLLGSANYSCGAFARALEEFQHCIPRLTELAISPREFYELMANTCRALRLELDAQRYSQLSKSS